MFLLIDNYDSFTYNLVHYLGELGAKIAVRRNDAVTVKEALALGDEGIVLSPGPCDPDRAGICLDLVCAAAGKRPLLGVCLGHQAIGQAFGGERGARARCRCTARSARSITPAPASSPASPRRSRPPATTR